MPQPKKHRLYEVDHVFGRSAKRKRTGDHTRHIAFDSVRTSTEHKQSDPECRRDKDNTVHLDHQKHLSDGISPSSRYKRVEDWIDLSGEPHKKYKEPRKPTPRKPRWSTDDFGNRIRAPRVKAPRVRAPRMRAPRVTTADRLTAIRQVHNSEVPTTSRLAANRRAYDSTRSRTLTRDLLRESPSPSPPRYIPRQSPIDRRHNSLRPSTFRRAPSYRYEIPRVPVPPSFSCSSPALSISHLSSSSHTLDREYISESERTLDREYTSESEPEFQPQYIPYDSKGRLLISRPQDLNHISQRFTKSNFTKSNFTKSNKRTMSPHAFLPDSSDDEKRPSVASKGLSSQVRPLSNNEKLRRLRKSQAGVQKKKRAAARNRGEPADYSLAHAIYSSESEPEFLPPKPAKVQTELTPQEKEVRKKAALEKRRATIAAKKQVKIKETEEEKKARREEEVAIRLEVIAKYDKAKAETEARVKAQAEVAGRRQMISDASPLPVGAAEGDVLPVLDGGAEARSAEVATSPEVAEVVSVSAVDAKRRLMLEAEARLAKDREENVIIREANLAKKKAARAAEEEARQARLENERIAKADNEAAAAAFREQMKSKVGLDFVSSRIVKPGPAKSSAAPPDDEDAVMSDAPHDLEKSGTNRSDEQFAKTSGGPDSEADANRSKDLTTSSSSFLGRQGMDSQDMPDTSADCTQATIWPSESISQRNVFNMSNIVYPTRSLDLEDRRRNKGDEAKGAVRKVRHAKAQAVHQDDQSEDVVLLSHTVRTENSAVSKSNTKPASSFTRHGPEPSKSSYDAQGSPIKPRNCQSCARRHLKCDKATPVCSNCRKDALECLYEASPKSTERTKRTSVPENLMDCVQSLDQLKIAKEKAEADELDRKEKAREQKSRRDWQRKLPKLHPEWNDAEIEAEVEKKMEARWRRKFGSTQSQQVQDGSAVGNSVVSSTVLTTTPRKTAKDSRNIAYRKAALKMPYEDQEDGESSESEEDPEEINFLNTPPPTDDSENLEPEALDLDYADSDNDSQAGETNDSGARAYIYFVKQSESTGRAGADEKWDICGAYASLEDANIAAERKIKSHPRDECELHLVWFTENGFLYSELKKADGTGIVVKIFKERRLVRNMDEKGRKSILRASAPSDVYHVTQIVEKWNADSEEIERIGNPATSFEIAFTTHDLAAANQKARDLFLELTKPDENSEAYDKWYQDLRPEIDHLLDQANQINKPLPKIPGVLELDTDGNGEGVSMTPWEPLIRIQVKVDHVDVGGPRN